MTRSKRDSVIDKIHKLLAVAAPDSGATEGERNAAQRRAADLMTRYQIEQAHLTDAKRGPIGQDSETIEGMTEKWRGELAGRICKAMGGDWYYTTLGRSRTGYTLVGRPEQIAFARTLTEHLIPQLIVECEAAYQKAIAKGATGTCSRCDGTGWTRRVKGGGYTASEHECPTCHGSGTVPLNARPFRREFFDAAGRKIASRIRAQRAETANEVGGKGTSTDLVRSDEAAIEAYYDSIGLTLSSRSTRGTGGSAAGRAAGHDAGTRADLAPGAKVGGGRGALPAGR